MRFPGRLIFRFGLFNLIALTILLGWKISLGALGFVLLTWSAINLITSLKNKSSSASRSLATLGFFLFLFFLFLLHKFNLANSEFSAQLKQTAPWLPAEILLPFFVTLSFSYIFVRCIDLAHSCIWKNAPLVDPISLMGYLVPFHMLVAGPVNIYDEHMRANERPSSAMTPVRVLLVINEITTGLFYKFVLAEGIRIYFYGLNGNISVTGWFDSLILVVYVFFDFAGYSRIARGLGLFYGIPTPVNFNAPFLATSVTDFWTRWHMSMGQFVRRNLFTPIQLQLVRRVGVKWAATASIVTMAISFSFVGLWHRMSWTWFLWGVAMGALMAVEKFVQTFLITKKWDRSGIAKIAIDSLGRVYVLLLIILSAYFVANEVFPI
jgi:D-alanyl-lipoteichoic acid acyltransferase DltB (MBOAT superfamily)|tara:strand:- start:408 stop:1544 length:1137 start_codon:yes stop_codon:yes gene_type:complete